MTIKETCLLFVIMLLACNTHVALAATDTLDSCPEFPAPKKAQLQIIAERMEINGLPMAIRRLESAEKPEAILAFYREEWAATEHAPAPVEYMLEAWQVIASQRGDCFFTVQVKPFGRNGSEALLGATAPPGGVNVKEDVPMLPGSNVLNDIGHNDAGKTARTVLLKNGFSTATNTDFYRRNLASQGWKVTSHYSLEQPGNYGDVIVLRRGLRELSIVSTRDAQNANKSNVLLNYVDQP